MKLSFQFWVFIPYLGPKKTKKTEIDEKDNFNSKKLTLTFKKKVNVNFSELKLSFSSISFFFVFSETK